MNQEFGTNKVSELVNAERGEGTAPSLTHARDGTFGWWVLVAEFAPKIASVLVFGAGLALLSSAAQPALPYRLTKLLDAWPLGLVELSHLMASIVGVLMLLIAGGLWRRLDGAYWLTLLLLIVGAVFSLIKALDFEEATSLLIVAAFLAPCRGAFFRRSQLTAALFSGPWILGVMLALGFSVWLMLTSYAHVEYRDDLWWTILKDNDISRSFRALAVAVVIGILALAWVSLHPSFPTPDKATKENAAEKAALIFAASQEARGEANLLYCGDKGFIFTPSGNSFIMYRQRGSHWIAMGDPVGPVSERDEALSAFHAAADQASANPVIYAASLAMLPYLVDHGFTVRKIGEAAIIDLDAFSLDGSSRARLRQTRSRSLRDGWEVCVLPPGSLRDWTGLKAVSDAWLQAHKGREKQFSLGRFERAYLERFPIAVVHKPDGAPVAFASLWPTPDKGIIAIDLMRYCQQAPPAVMDFLFLGIIDWAKGEGFKTLDLGMTPLAGLSRRHYAPLFSKLGAAVYVWGDEIYGFKGLRAYKAKFQPKWTPVFIAASSHVSLPVALLDAALLTSGGLLGAFKAD
jgi:phosphatidylglycerol lysyltransferase